MATTLIAWRASCREMGADVASGLVTQPVAARLIRVKPGTLKTWRWKLVGPPFIKRGRSVLYPIDKLAEWHLEKSEEVSF